MNEKTIQVLIDGLGSHETNVTSENTLKDVAAAFDLQGYTLTVDGEVVPPMNWDAFRVFDVGSIWATKGQKGAC